MKGEKSKRPMSTNSDPSVRQKNSKPLNPNKSQTFWYRHRKKIILFGIYLLAAAFASYLFYRRFPENFTQPNFYAEDGFVFGSNIIHHGFINSLFATFNGYYIWGIYILEKIGFVINALIYGNQFIDLPKSLALTSYIFLGLTATLPLLLFRRLIKLPALILICLFSIYVPLLSYDYAIVGTIGNLKFAFVYIAFLLLIYRNFISEGSKRFFIVDLALLICAYTDVTVYLMLPFALLRYAKLIRPNAKSIRGLLKLLSFQSLFVLGVILLLQLLVVAHNGVPKLQGYLSNPYESSRTVEIFLSRSYIFPVVFTSMKSLNNTSVIFWMIVFLLVTWFGLKGKRKLLLFGLYTILITSVLFVSQRTGVSALFLGYKTSGPDQFFYAQNWVFIFILGLLLSALVTKLKVKPLQILIYVLVSYVILFIYAPKSGSFGSNDLMAQNVGTLINNAHNVCIKYPNAKQLNIPIYPANSLQISNIARSSVCTPSVINYQPMTVSFGLKPFNNNYALLGSKLKFYQTFVSPQPKLDGVSVYFSDFGENVKTPYRFQLLDSTCKNVLDSVNIPVGKIRDNSFLTINLPVIDQSKGVSYCFSINSFDSMSPSPLAIQLTQPGVYTAGTTTLNNKVISNSVVFNLNYKD